MINSDNIHELNKKPHYGLKSCLELNRHVSSLLTQVIKGYLISKNIYQRNIRFIPIKIKI